VHTRAVRSRPTAPHSQATRLQGDAILPELPTPVTAGKINSRNSAALGWWFEMRKGIDESLREF